MFIGGECMAKVTFVLECVTISDKDIFFNCIPFYIFYSDI